MYLSFRMEDLLSEHLLIKIEDILLCQMYVRQNKG